MTAAHTYVYLNGDRVRADKAFISIQDRGFRFGDGLFETIGVYRSRPYLLAQHLRRLSEGAKALRIPIDIKETATLCERLLRSNKVNNGILRIVISRGSGSLGYLPASHQPTVLIETQAKPAAQKRPVKLWLSTYEKISPRALPVRYKLGQGLSSTLARMEAQAQGCDEALLLNAQKKICEASASNIFWLRGGTLYTPALTCGILPGVIREAVMKLSPWPVREGAYVLAQLHKAEAVVLTNSVHEILPVASLGPKGYAWRSETLAKTLLKLLHADISKHIA